MSEIIRTWIKDCIGVIMDMNPETFASDVMDGTILARILLSYYIIDEGRFISILPTDNHNIAYKNLKKLGHWLKVHDIICSEDDLFDVSMGKCSSAIKLFYLLYLELHDKDRVYFIAKKKAKERLHPTNTRFIITPVAETIDDPSDIPDHPLSKPLVLHKDVIEWNKNRYQSLLEDYELMRDKYSKYINDRYGITYTDKFAKDVGKPETQSTVEIDQLNNITEEDEEEVEDYPYKELLEQEKAALEMEAFKEDPKVAKKIVNTIKQKRRRQLRENETKIHQQKLLLMDLWEKLIKEQEKEFEEGVSKKLLKQSVFEKQMVTKMLEVRQQKHDMLENRRFVDEEIMKKREAEFLEHVFRREKSVGDQKYNYYFERDRALELHRRLYAEKKRLKSERHFNMCFEITNALVDITLRHMQYKKDFDEEPCQRVKNEWANLFIKGQPIFDILEDVEEVVQDTADLPPEIEDIYRAEIERQNDLDQGDFENYFNYEWPWQLEDLLENYEDKLLSIELGMNVLGHDAHRVLLAKYPNPKPPPKPNIPKVTIAACVNGLPDLMILPVLQKLLKEKGVRIIEMQQAINFCVAAFNNEIQTEYIDIVLNKETGPALEELKGKKSKSSGKGTGKSVEKPKKGTKPKSAKPPKSPKSPKEEEKFAEKQSQTPKIYPCEEIVLSPKGDLGKMAYDLLNIGEPLTDTLVVAMFVEYLKSLENIKGWVLINFPTTLEQAALLEEALTGIQVPGIGNQLDLVLAPSIGDVADLDYRESQWERLTENERLRKSKLLPNPNPPSEEVFYDTYLTAYINAQPKTLQKESKPNGSDSEIEENPDYLGQFYMDQGCNYAFFYETFELATIKHLAKLIIGDYTIPPKTSLELFGDTVLYVEGILKQDRATPGMESKSAKKGSKKEAPKKQSKVEVPPVADDKKKKGKDKKSSNKNSKKSKADVVIVAVTREDKETQIPEPQPIIEEIYIKPPPEPRPGEPCWQYSDLQFPEHIQIALATLWESAEEVYISDFKELLFIKRIILNAVIPYVTNVRKHLQVFIARPDTKQNYLYQFQTMYNEIDADMRDDEELKAELHCRIAEFREKLWEICDRRMNESELERQRIIKENWVPIQAAELTNNCLTAMQLEIDRTCDSFQFLTDYYMGTITKMPSDDSPLQKTILKKLEMGTFSSTTSFSQNIMDVINSILMVPNTESTDTYFHQTLKHTVETANQAVRRWKSACTVAVDKMDSALKPASSKKDKPKKESSSRKTKDERKLPKFAVPDPDVREAAPRLIKEWTCAINSENLRCNLRLDLLLARGLQELNDILNCTKKTFHNLHQTIYNRYNQEIHSIDTACEVIAAAVEAEVPLQPELVLDGERFYVQPNVLLFPQPLPPPEPPIREREREGTFTMPQLEGLANILKDLAPNSSIPERAFVFLLQDAIVQNAEDGKESMVPLLWKKLQPNQVSQLSQKLFGDVEFIDWRDFLVYNLCVEFPSEEDLLKTRDEFRQLDPDATETVKDYQFYGVTFWFEGDFRDDDPQDALRLKLIKQQLFKLFRINEDTLNYTELLLAFCKDACPIKGFAKALSLALGKLVCWDTKIGCMYVESVREQRLVDEKTELKRQLAHQKAIDSAASVVNTLIDTTVHLCDSVIIEDYAPEESASDVTEKKISSTDVDFESPEGLQELYSSQSDFSDAMTKHQEFLLEEEFSNVEIGFQPLYNSTKVYLLPFEDLLTVLTAALPWHARAQTTNDNSFRERMEEIYDNVRNSEFGGAVLTHELLNSKLFVDLLCNNCKFVVKNPPKLVAEMVEDNTVVNVLVG